MLNASLTNVEWDSYRFLHSLFIKNVVFSLPKKFALALREPLAEEDMVPKSKLVIAGESISLSCLFDVQRALSEHVTVVDFSLEQKVASGISAVASVSCEKSDALAERIEAVANQFQCEIALIDKRPSLSRPGLLLMDMDSTVIGIECIDEIAELAGVGSQVRDVTELAMQGKLDFAQSLHQRVACLGGASSTILEQVKNSLPVNPGITHLLHVLREAGWTLAIASGGFVQFAEYLQRRLALDYVIANRLEERQGQLTGNVLGDIVTAQTKADTLVSLAEQYGIPVSQTIALGDGANDLVMMNAAGLGVAYHAKPLVRQQADASIRYGGADTLLAFLEN